LTILDSNILLTAWNQTTAEHAQTKGWLENLLNSEEPIGLPWVTIWAFLRISTSPRAFTKPLESEAAFGVVRGLLALPNASIVDPGPRHIEILANLVKRRQVRGPLMTDAVLAAIGIEIGAVIASLDEDFRRFPEVRWLNPLDSADGEGP
jgi:toxin-antitoxin system PIN domain toxin